MDVQKERRSFPGVNKATYYTLEDMQKGDCGGITESDHITSGKEDGEYTDINYTSGPVRDWSGTKLGFEVSVPNSKKYGNG